MIGGDSTNHVRGADVRPPTDRRTRGSHFPAQDQAGRRRPTTHVPRPVDLTQVERLSAVQVAS